jgi:Sulfotransferase domain
MRIIGAGVGRTGTLSLKAALERLGFGPCFHGRHVLDHPDRLPGWLAAARGEDVDWAVLLAGYESTVDWPAAAFWRPLARFYPQARFILTIREPDGWYDSVSNTIYRMFGSQAPEERVAHAREVVPGLETFTDFHRQMIWDGFFSGRFADRDYAIAAYERHNAEVIAELPADRLLVIPPGAGWVPLCDFLGVPVPEEPYPHLNDPEKFWARVQARISESQASS